MKDAFYPIRKAYAAVLKNNITLNGKTVPVVDAATDSTKYPYVLLSQQNSQATSLRRGCESYETTMLLEIVTGYQNTGGGKKDADMIADQIYQLLTPALPAQEGFQIDECYPDSDFDQGRELTATSTINRRFIRFRNQVSER